MLKCVTETPCSFENARASAASEATSILARRGAPQWLCDCVVNAIVAEVPPLTYKAFTCGMATRPSLNRHWKRCVKGYGGVDSKAFRRELLVLAYVNARIKGVKKSEIPSRLGVSERTVRRLLQRCKIATIEPTSISAEAQFRGLIESLGSVRPHNQVGRGVADVPAG